MAACQATLHVAVCSVCPIPPHHTTLPTRKTVGTARTYPHQGESAHQIARVLADDGGDTRQARQRPHSPSAGRTPGLGNYGYRAARDDTHAQRLPVLLPASSACHTPALGRLHAPTKSGYHSTRPRSILRDQPGWR